MKLWKRILRFNFAVGLIATLLVVGLYRADASHIPVYLARSFAVVFFVVTPVTLMLSRFGGAMYARPVPMNWLLIGSSILACTAAGNLLLNLCSLALGLLPSGHFWHAFWMRAQFSAVLALISGVGAVGYHALRQDLKSATLELKNRQLEQERASKLAVEAQLASLESHIRPHFLFNTLNTISALISEDPKRAEALVGKLAALLRSSLDSNQERTVTIERELRFVNDYLEIERARYGDRLRFRIEVPPELRSAEVPALALHTLVENSVKHAVGSRFEGAEIRVAAYAAEDSVFVKVLDDGPGFSADCLRPGHGLDNLALRLTALFGSTARLEISSEGGAAVGFCVPRTSRI